MVLTRSSPCDQVSTFFTAKPTFDTHLCTRNFASSGLYSKFRNDRAPAYTIGRAHRYSSPTFEVFLFFFDFSASVSIFFAPSTSFSVRRAARYRSRRLGAPFTFAPPGPVTSTAFGFSSLVSISYSTSSPYERVITIRHRQSRARALKKSPRWVSAPAPPPRPA